MNAGIALNHQGPPRYEVALAPTLLTVAGTLISPPSFHDPLGCFDGEGLFNRHDERTSCDKKHDTLMR